MDSYFVPVLIALAAAFAVFVFVRFAIYIWHNFQLWSYNFNSPTKSYPARVISKRVETTGFRKGLYGGTVETDYYVTFEFRTGDRREYYVEGNDYGLVKEGDEGWLTVKGTLFCQFDRASA